METYEKPEVTEYGDLAELTEASTFGNKTDVDFGTPGFAVFSCDPSVPPACQQF